METVIKAKNKNNKIFQKIISFPSFFKKDVVNILYCEAMSKRIFIITMKGWEFLCTHLVKIYSLSKSLSKYLVACLGRIYTLSHKIIINIYKILPCVPTIPLFYEWCNFLKGCASYLCKFARMCFYFIYSY